MVVSAAARLLVLGLLAALACRRGGTEMVASEMALVRGGSLTMGNDGPGDPDERPAHQVQVSDFFLGRHEVTQAEYRAVMGRNPSRFQGDDRRPVENLTWYDAIAFCNARSELEGLASVYVVSGETVTADWSKEGYRLPTEAEWESAARGGAAAAEPGRLEKLDAVAWFSGNAQVTTHPVATRAADGLGLHDMRGNVWEWCWDRYGSYGAEPGRDPRGDPKGGNRVIRGCSWHSPAFLCRVANRSYSHPTRTDGDLGFRLARSAPSRAPAP